MAEAIEFEIKLIYIYCLCPENITYFLTPPRHARKYVLVSVNYFQKGKYTDLLTYVPIGIPICSPVRPVDLLQHFDAIPFVFKITVVIIVAGRMFASSSASLASSAIMRHALQ